MLFCCRNTVSWRFADIHMLYEDMSSILSIHTVAVKRKGDVGMTFEVGPEFI